MKKTLLLAGIATAFFVNNANAANIAPYVSDKLNYSLASHDVKYVDGAKSGKTKFSDNIWGFDFAVGAKMFNSFRAELEYGFKQKAKKKLVDGKSEVSNQSLMVNAYYDIPTGTNFAPYIGGGLGLSFLELKWKDVDPAYNYKKSDVNFTWQLGLGLAYNFNNNWALDFGYRYTDAGDVKKTASWGYDKAEATYHEFLLGARYTF